MFDYVSYRSINLPSLMSLTTKLNSQSILYKTAVGLTITAHSALCIIGCYYLCRGIKCIIPTIGKGVDYFTAPRRFNDNAHNDATRADLGYR